MLLVLVTPSQTIGSMPYQDIKPESFRPWMCVEFIPDSHDRTDLGASYDVWCMVVNEVGEDRIAPFEIHEPELNARDESL